MHVLQTSQQFQHPERYSIILTTVWGLNSGPLDLEVLNAQIVGPVLRGYIGDELK